MKERLGGMPTITNQKQTEAGLGGGISEEIRQHPVFQGIASEALETTPENLVALSALGEEASQAAIHARYAMKKPRVPSQPLKWATYNGG